MTTETLMTESAANTTEGQAASTTEAPATAADNQGQQQQATEGQNTEGQQAEGAKAEGGQAKPEGAPDKYEFKAPEGAEFDTQVIENFSEVAKELNLTQDAAQKILDKMAPKIAARQVERLEAARTEWAESAKADKEFGGDKLTENIAVASKALEAFGTPELRALLNETGLGNHPEVIRFFYRSGKAISEDRFVGGGSAQAEPATIAQRMYPNMNP